MMSKLVFILLCLPLLTHGQALDETLLPHTRGEVVVDAVIDKIRPTCLFAEDKYFMRRLAAVQTDFGKNMSANEGGIWKVQNNMINAVKSNCGGNLRAVCNSVQQRFHFDLTQVTMNEMDIPLYSGLVMRAYLTTLNKDIPGSIAEQARFWRDEISSRDMKEYTGKANIPAACSAVKMDLVFAIDASGSVGSTNFQKTLNFLELVVEDLTIGPNLSRIAVIRFESRATISFDLDKYNSVFDIRQAINNIRYTGGGTNTEEALKLTSTIFKKARQHVPKVLVLITDGYSNSYYRTVSAADVLKSESITIFTIGIGSVNKREMLKVASTPNCTHFFDLKSYAEIDTIINEIQRESCVAPLMFTSTNGTMNDTHITDNPLPPVNETKAQTIAIDTSQSSTNKSDPQDIITVKVDVVCGIVNVYVSITVAKPSSAVYDIKSRAIDGSPAWIQAFSQSELYITLISERRTDLSNSECTNPHYNISINPVNTSTTAICRENGINKICTDGDIKELYSHLFVNTQCETGANIPNPCTTDNILNKKMRFPHPKLLNMYIQCKITGGMEIVTCPTGTTYNAYQSVCGPHVTAPSSNSVPYTGPNPCTRKAIMKRQFYFAHPSDSSAFIQCDEWQNAFLVYCGNDTVWSQQAYTCVHKSVLSSSFNPCNSSTNVFYYANPANKASFIQCDVNGNAFIQSCPITTVWSQAAQGCIHDSCSQCSKQTYSSTTDSTITTTAAAVICSMGDFIPVPNDVKSYYVCGWENQLRKFTCPHTLVWSQKFKTCTWP